MENKEVLNQPIENQKTANTEAENNTAQPGSSKWMWILGLTVLLILFLAGAWYLRGQLTLNNAQYSAQITQIKTDLDSLNTEVDAIDLGDLEKDLSEIDKDLSSL